MDRRKFIQATSLSGFALGTFGTFGCNLGNKQEEDKKNEKEAGSVRFQDFALNETTIGELQKQMQSGARSSREITEMYLKRIGEIDRAGPRINAVIELNPDALSIAEALDKERKAGKIRGPLHGIPVLIKDNIDTNDKLMTTAGSLALLGHQAARDAFIIKQLREAGAVLLGKTNLSEWANFRSTRSTSGWSSRGGQTKNPCMLDRNTCGSSSGSAAGVSANLCVVAIGTETDGSIIAPSSFCGIVGLKPTVGLLSRSGIIPISKTQDTAGPMARTVMDAAILLGALAGTDPDDPSTGQYPGRVIKDYTIYLDANGLKGKRIGIEKSFLKGHEGVVDLYQKAIALLKKQGATLVEVELVKQINELGPFETLVLQYEFKEGLNRYLKQAHAGIKTLAKLIEFNKKNEASVMPYFKQEELEQSETKGGLDSPEYTEALRKTLSSRLVIDELIKTNRLDAIAGTSIGLPCAIDLINGDYETGFYFCQPAAMAGYPHITVPMGKVHELPVGFSFITGAWQEGELIRLAYAFEQASLHRSLPKFIPTSVPV